MVYLETTKTGTSGCRKETSRSSGRPLAIGCDDRGEEIVCVYKLGADGLTVYPITAYYSEV